MLRDAVAPHAVLTPDLPGTGARWREASPWRIDEVVVAVRSQLRAAGIAAPYPLLGLSMGGMVVTRWMHAWPGDVQRAVLVNSSLRGVSPLHHRLRPSAWADVARAAWPGLSVWERESIVLRLTSCGADTPTRRALIDEWVRLQAAHPVSRMNALRQLVAAARFRVPAGRPPMPVLVVGSRGDRLVSPACSEALARHWACDFVQHPDAGHDLPLDDPEWLVQAVRSWAD
jgi:pimeloyl-ACP methyl ester carboxylesterase